MAILDINKNSLPEQVQENKENIAALQTAMDDKASIDYVDEKDADTLQSAKDYTDDTSIPKSLFTKPGSLITSDNDNNPKEFRTNGYSHGYIVTNADGLGNNGFAVQSNIPVGDIDAIATAGKVLTADGNYGCDWQDPSIKAANVDSESETSGKVLAADGNGGAAWITPSSGGGLSLVWSGSQTLSNTITSSLFTSEADKKYCFAIKLSVSEQPKFLSTPATIDQSASRTIINTFVGSPYASQKVYIYAFSTNKTGGFLREALLELDSAITKTYPNTYVLTEIYEVN